MAQKRNASLHGPPVRRPTRSSKVLSAKEVPDAMIRPSPSVTDGCLARPAFGTENSAECSSWPTQKRSWKVRFSYPENTHNR